MGWIPKTLTFIGLLLLAHAIYSAHEYTSLRPVQTSSSTIPHKPHPPSSPTTTLPLDIRIETLLASALLLIAIVSGAPPLRPIRWAQWAGRIEREGWDPARGTTGNKAGAANPYRGLEERRGFVDVRKQRREFAEWVRAG